ARRRVDVDPGGVAEEGRGGEGLEAEAADTRRRIVLGRVRGHAGAAGEEQGAAMGRRRELGDRDAAVRAALDAGVAVDQLEVVDRRLQRLCGQIEELAADLVRGLDDGPAVVEGRLAARAATVIRP